MWPQVPENLTSLSVQALRDLAAEIRTCAITALGQADLSAEGRAEVAQFLAKRDEIKALATSKEADAAALAALEADVEVVPEIEAEVEVVPATEVEVAQPTAAVVPVTFGQEGVETPKRGPRLTPDYLTATDGIPGKKSGEGYESWRELAAAAVGKSNTIRANSSERFEVARIVGDYPANRQLSDDVNFNMARFEPDELMAAMCAPATPYYNLACMQTLRRPVFGSLPQFQAPRMKVSIMPSPTLADITTGVDVWTETDENNLASVKSTCQTITCGSPTEYVMYGVYRCLTVKNMMAMSYPELVEAWLNRLGAAHSRLAEQQLLNAMGTAATAVATPFLGYGGSTSIVSTILNYVALYQDSQRWDITENLDAWLPRWVRTAMKMDIYRRRNTNGNVNKVPSDSEIDSMFNGAGVNPHWFIDTPDWATPIPSIGATLNVLPQDVNILIAPPGKFAVMDRGELAIGVTGNGLYRDNTSNSKNQFTFFFENFEGLVDTTSCPAHLLTIPACWNGVQVDDQLVNCLGRDIGGYQS